MLAILAKIGLLGSVRQRLRAASVKLTAYAIAAILAAFALAYLLHAAYTALTLALPSWVAAVIIAAALLAIAFAIVAIGGMVAQRRERRAAAALTAPNLAAAFVPLTAILRRYPRQIVLLALVAGALFELTRSRR